MENNFWEESGQQGLTPGIGVEENIALKSNWRQYLIKKDFNI